MKRLQYILVFFIFCLLSLNIHAAVYTGNCGKSGKNVKYSFDDQTGVMQITGSGEMADYTANSSAPWRSVRPMITSIVIENGVTSIGSYAFDNCTALTSISIPATITSINSYALCVCTSLPTITLPQSVTQIGEYAFFKCEKLTTINIPSGITTLSTGLFYGCKALNNISLPSTITSVGMVAFYNCSSLPFISLPKGTTSIGNNAFYGCTSLVSATLPSTITSIGNNAFYGCSSMQSMTCLATTLPGTGSALFQNIYIKEATLYAPTTALNRYKSRAPWNAFGYFVGVQAEMDDIIDGQAYTQTQTMSDVHFNYIRQFSNTVVDKWQPLFVPFDIELTDNISAKCDIARPYAIALNDAEAEGMDAVVVQKLSAGEVAQHGTPYFIRPKKAGEFRIEVNAGRLYSNTDTTPLSFTTANNTYSFIGQYTTGKPAADVLWYALAGAVLRRGTTESLDLPAQRWYMTMSNTVAGAQQLRIITWEEDDTPTGITTFQSKTRDTDAIYSITGSRLSKMQKGINIINGKKIILR